MRLTERYMDPPGQAMPDCLVAARSANHMERVLRRQGKAKYATILLRECEIAHDMAQLKHCADGRWCWPGWASLV